MVQVISRSLIDTVAEAAARSARLRMNHNFHSGPADNPHRFLNVLLRGTYIRPHKHANPAKAETFIALEGSAAIFIFDEAGAVTGRFDIGGVDAPLLGVDISPGVWHTVVALTERVVCFEVKPGPWEPSSDKEFAAWAPAEDDAGCEHFIEGLLAVST